jgi:hypothetical protein
VAYLSNVCHLARVTRKFTDTALVQFLCITGLFWFCKLLQGIGSLECYSYVSMLEKVCGFPYFWAVVSEGSPFFLFLLFPSISSWLVFCFALNLLV